MSRIVFIRGEWVRSKEKDKEKASVYVDQRRLEGGREGLRQQRLFRHVNNHVYFIIIYSATQVASHSPNVSSNLLTNVR